MKKVFVLSILNVFILTWFIVSIVFSATTKFDIAYNSIRDKEYPFIHFNNTNYQGIDNKHLDAMKNSFSDSFLGGFIINETFNATNSLNTEDKVLINGVLEGYDYNKIKLELLSGSFPTNEMDVIIPSYLADYLIRHSKNIFGEKIDDYDKLVSKLIVLGNNKLIINGVFKSDIWMSPEHNNRMYISGQTIFVGKGGLELIRQSNQLGFYSSSKFELSLNQSPVSFKEDFKNVNLISNFIYSGRETLSEDEILLPDMYKGLEGYKINSDISVRVSLKNPNNKNIFNDTKVFKIKGYVSSNLKNTFVVSNENYQAIIKNDTCFNLMAVQESGMFVTKRLLKRLASYTNSSENDTVLTTNYDVPQDLESLIFDIENMVWLSLPVGLFCLLLFILTCYYINNELIKKYELKFNKNYLLERINLKKTLSLEIIRISAVQFALATLMAVFTLTLINLRIIKEGMILFSRYSYVIGHFNPIIVLLTCGIILSIYFSLKKCDRKYSMTENEISVNDYESKLE